MNQSPVLTTVVLVAAGVWGFIVAAPGRFVCSDLTQDYLSVVALAEGKSVYAPLPVNVSLNSNTNETTVNDHPPPYILALAPIGLVTYPMAFVGLAIANAVAGVTACGIIAREFKWSARTAAILAVGLLMHPGTLACLRVGNVSLLLFLLVVLGWRVFRGERSSGAGLWLGLATALKLYPGLLILGLMTGRAWRGVAVAGMVIVACWAAAALVVGLDDVNTYTRVRAPENAKTYVSHGFNLSVAGVAHRLFGLPNSYSPWLDRAMVNPMLAESLAWSARVCVGLIVAAGMLRARRSGNDPDMAFAILVPGMLLLSPLTWLHAVPMMILPVAILFRTETGYRFVMLVACALAMCLNDHWVATQWVNSTGENVPWTVNLLLHAPTWGMLGVLLIASFPRRPAAS